MPEFRFNPLQLQALKMRADEAVAQIDQVPQCKELYLRNILDASQTLTTARELVQIKKTLYYTKFPNFLADKLCPVSTNLHTGAREAGYDMLEPTGAAEIVDDDSKDPPVAEIKKSQTTQPVRTIKLAIRWNIQDVREASLAQMSGLSANYSFTQEKTRAVLLGIKRKEEDIFVQGSAKHGVPGFLNNSNIGLVALPSSLSSVKWSEATPEQLVQFLNLVRNGVSSGSKGVFLVNTLIMSPAAHDVIATKPFSGNNGTASETVLSFYLRTQRQIVPNFDIVRYAYNEIIEASDTYTITGYFKDPMVLNQEIPQPMETFGPVTADGGQTFETTVRERHAGVQLRYPVAAKQIKPKK